MTTKEFADKYGMAYQTAFRLTIGVPYTRSRYHREYEYDEHGLADSYVAELERRKRVRTEKHNKAIEDINAEIRRVRQLESCSGKGT